MADPFPVRVPVDRLIVARQALFKALNDDIYYGRWSRTQAPIDVWYLPEEKKWLLADGHHRLVEMMLASRIFEIDARQVGEGYTDYWVVPPEDKRFRFRSTRYGGLESLSGTNGLRKMAKQLKDRGANEESPLRDRLIADYNAGSYGIDEGDLTLDGRTIGTMWIAPEYGDDEKFVELSKIEILPQYQERGYARGAIEQLTKLADEKGFTVVLTPAKDFGASVPRLKRFYKSLGFVENKGRNKNFAISDSMYRKPRTPGAREAKYFPPYPPTEAEVSAQLERQRERTPAQSPEDIAKLSDAKLEAMPTEDLDRAAFGFASGDIIEIPIDQIDIKYTGDYDEAWGQLHSDKRKVRSYLKWSERVPVDVTLAYSGVFYLDDGHHRFIARKLSGKKTIKAMVKIKANPIVELRRMANGGAAEASEARAQPEARFYHGSFSDLPVGTILEGSRHKEMYERDDQEKLFEQLRPSSAVSHMDAIFMVQDPKFAESAGGGGPGDYLYEVEPIGHVSGPYDGAWWGEIANAKFTTYEIRVLRKASAPIYRYARFIRMAAKYWDGKPCEGSNCYGAWEWLTPRAKIVRVVKRPEQKATG